MFFRFAAALLVAVAVSMLSVALEKQTLQLRRSVSRQHYQTDLLLDMHAQLRLQIQQRTSPAVATSDGTYPAVTSRDQRQSATGSERSSSNGIHSPGSTTPLPLLRWERPLNPVELR